MKKRLLTQKLNDLTSLVIKVNGSVEIFLNNSETDDYFDIVLNSENQSFEFGNSLILTNNDDDLFNFEKKSTILDSLIGILQEIKNKKDSKRNIRVDIYIKNRAEMNMEARARYLAKKYGDGRYFAAVYLNPERLDEIFWSAGYKSESQVKLRAAQVCGEQCKLVAVFSNTCMMLAEPRGNTDVSRVVVAYDPIPEQAIQKAKEACTHKYGADCVAYEQLPGAEHRAYCVGYDYGVYDDGR